ncbi:hypothetical protein, partial [Campylobacter lari]|uniref:hypothetical protein n=1 Tax=Campylobacter lari TaxID=201 RepID=UPI00214A8626
TNNVLLIGNKVDIQGGRLGNEKSKTHLVGNEVFVDADSVKLSSTINVTALEGGYIQRQMINFANDNYSFGNNIKINNADYTETNGQTHKGSSSFKKALTIGNMGDEKANTIEWWHFAKGWNEGLGRDIDEFRLVDDIDFSGTTVDPIAYDYKNAFDKMFNGNGYTLKNITINANKDYNVGLFGVINNAEISNIAIDTINFKYDKDLPFRIGGFAGYIGNSNISNITLNNIGAINGVRIVGGFSGNISDSYISNVTINQIESISALNEGQSAGNAVGVGGFTGMNSSTTYDNIILNNIGDISLTNKIGNVLTSYIGWFVGRSDQLSSSGNANSFKNIAIDNVGNISVNGAWGNYDLYIGSFAGALYGSQKDTIQNIYIFIGKNSQISYNRYFRGYYLGKFAGILNANLDNVHIYSNDNTLSNINNDSFFVNDFNKNGYISDKINIHTYNDSTQNDAYKDFLSKADTIQKPSKPIDPTDPDVVLESDDVISANDLNKWLDEIYNGTYWVDIKDLKLQGVSEEIQQSIAFLEALYGQSGMQDILEKISTDYKKASDKFNTFNKNKTELLLFINTQLKDLVNATNDKLNILLTKQKELDTLIKAYNNYVALINKGLANESDPEFITLKNQINTLMSESDVLASEIGLNQNTLKLWQDKASKDSNGHFKI